MCNSIWRILKRPLMHTPRKRFGQNFLTDHHVIRQIVDSLGLNPNSHAPIVEIGPGQGALTKYILAQVPRLTVVEIDRDLVEKLRKHYGEYYEGLSIICEDALNFDFRTLYDTTHPELKLKVIGNLPYNISTPLLFHLFEYNDCIEDMHFMLQKEVVDRMVASPNSKEYGRLSIMTQYFCEVEPLFSVPPTAFYPAPKVESAVIRLRPHKAPRALTQSPTFYRCFDTVVKTAFSKRRKTLWNALRDLVDQDMFTTLNLEPTLRAENLSVEDYIRIGDYLNQKTGYIEK